MRLEKEEFISKATSIIKEVRLSMSLSQNVMSELIGISKKTYVQIEMHRRRLSWPEAVSFCSCFKNNKIVLGIFKEDPTSIAENLTKDEIDSFEKNCPKSYWWIEVSHGKEFFIHQNIITGQYKIVDLNGDTILVSNNVDLIKDFIKNNVEIKLQS